MREKPAGKGIAMSDLYSSVRPPEQRRVESKKKISWMILIGLLVFFVCGFVLMRLAGYKTRVREFYFRLSDSTVYAYQNDSLYAAADGKRFHVTGEHDYDVYKYITVRSMGRNALTMPGREAELRLEYGDGAVLEMWEDSGGSGSYIRFRSAEGAVFRFRSGDIRLHELAGRYLKPEKNTGE